MVGKKKFSNIWLEKIRKRNGNMTLTVTLYGKINCISIVRQGINGNGHQNKISHYSGYLY
jgi:hypothetical protein